MADTSSVIIDCRYMSLCEDMGIDRAALEHELAAAGFEYMPEINQFR